MKFKVDDYVVWNDWPDWIWRVADVETESEVGRRAPDLVDRGAHLTLEPFCNLDGGSHTSLRPGYAFAEDCEHASALLVIAVEASR